MSSVHDHPLMRRDLTRLYKHASYLDPDNPGARPFDSSPRSKLELPDTCSSLAVGAPYF
jgi:hypothetical protein